MKGKQTSVAEQSAINNLYEENSKYYCKIRYIEFLIFIFFQFILYFLTENFTCHWQILILIYYHDYHYILFHTDFFRIPSVALIIPTSIFTLSFREEIWKQTQKYDAIRCIELNISVMNNILTSRAFFFDIIVSSNLCFT
jgi:hypothetical protein